VSPTRSQALTFADGTPVSIDAWTGEETAAAPMWPQREGWALSKSVIPRGEKLAPTPIDPANWRDPRVGWGLVLPERPDLDAAALARPDDAPEPIRQLFQDRDGAKVLRYRPGTQLGSWVLRDYVGGSDLPVATSPEGTGRGCLPAYLLIAATPDEVPWQVQYRLNPVRYVGRLDLADDGLQNYIDALRRGWSDSAARYDSPVVWSVDHGGDDITSLMRDAIGEPLHSTFRGDADMPGARFVDGRDEPADAKGLLGALTVGRPSVVVTTSHGMTAPLDQPELMRARLGALVDSSHRGVDPADILARWQPDGAVWFAQACCSAGCDQPSVYRGLFDPESLVGRVLDGVASLGALTSPLPRALLGAAKPLRAFIGHVEPTFDRTMLFPPTRQRLTESLRSMVYQGICGGRPAGLALGGVYRPIGSLLLSHSTAVDAYDASPPGPAARHAVDMALYNKVTAYDRANTVLLGDPTVAIPLAARA
jgi:hypothetical protein